MCTGTTYIHRCCGQRIARYIDICEDSQNSRYGIPHSLLGLTRYRRECPNCRADRLSEQRAAQARHEADIPRAKALLEYFNGERESPFTDRELAAREAATHEATREEAQRASKLTFAEFIVDPEYFPISSTSPTSNEMLLRNGNHSYMCYLWNHYGYTVLFTETRDQIFFTALKEYVFPTLLGTYSESFTPRSVESDFYTGCVAEFVGALDEYGQWLRNLQGKHAATDLANFQEDREATFTRLLVLLTQPPVIEEGRPLDFHQWRFEQRTPVMSLSVEASLAWYNMMYLRYLTEGGWDEEVAEFRAKSIIDSQRFRRRRQASQNRMCGGFCRM